MNIYQELYKSKLTDVEGALSIIRSGDSITSGCAGIEPVSILSQLHTLAADRRNIAFFNGLGMREYEFITNPEYADVFSTDCVFMMAAARKAQRLGLTSVFPSQLHNGFSRWAEYHKPDVFICAATPMDKNGYMHISMCLIHEKDAFERAGRVIIEVNPNLPVIYGDTEIHIRDVDCIVEADYGIPQVPRGEINERDNTIGKYIAEMVKDGDTIQLGIGGIPDAAAMALMDKHDLGVHTEMLTNSLVDLFEAGVITGKKKTLHKGKMVGVFTLGDQRLYDMLDRNPGIMLMRGSYANNPYIIAQNDNMISINNALSVDLTGQICSESIGSLAYSGTGGQCDTAVGALHAKNGRNIIAVKSTTETKDGIVSNINAQLEPGSVVTLSRNDVDFIISEYGIAPLRGRSVRERVNNLIAIAHPDYRAQLKKDAARLYLW